jgi:dimethylamine/trimethylamine dehydrogenase
MTTHPDRTCHRAESFLSSAALQWIWLADAQGMAAMRGMKAEGGWGVVCTEETEIHYTSDLSPFFEGRIWSDDDIPAWQLMTEAVHKHGALAGIELSYNGRCRKSLFTRAAAF